MKYKIKILIIIFISFFLSCSKDNPSEPAKDVYDTVKIGNQVWMLKNLDVERYRNGDPIPQVTDSSEWVNLSTGAWCYYNNDSALGKIYGKLYNWYAVNDTRGLAPKGWHVPSDSEWTIITAYYGNNSIAGGNLKEIGTLHWLSPNTGATNLSGFTALPGGWRGSLNLFYALGSEGNWWTTTENNLINAWGRHLLYNTANIDVNLNNKVIGFSVRCVRD